MPYKVSVALRRFDTLIWWTAWKARHDKNFRMTCEDIHSEGLLVLVNCCREFPEGKIRFGRYFKKAWYNRLKDMRRDSMRDKREGTEVEIQEAFSIPEPQPDNLQFIDMVKEKFYEISPLLSEDARRMLRLLLDPSQELVEYAWRDFCRKNKLKSQGKHVYNYKRFRISLKHIQGVLEMSPSKMRKVVAEVKVVNRKLYKNNRGGRK